MIIVRDTVKFTSIFLNKAQDQQRKAVMKINLIGVNLWVLKINTSGQV